MSGVFRKIAVASTAFLLSINLTFAAENQFHKNLYFGLRSNSDVVILQNFLRERGFFNLESSGNYLGVTREAVRKFQITNDIKPASGFFGPLTRAVANNAMGKLASNNTPASATSTYFGKVEINYANSGESVRDEHITMYNIDDNTSISVTGFKILNSNKDEFVIPRGHNLPGISPVAMDEIILRPNDRLKILASQQEKQINFRENLCAGYFNQNSDFGGELGGSCPKPSVRNNLKLPDHCIKVFEGARSCRTIDISKIQIPECLEFSEAHFNYQGCVNDFKNRKDFHGSQWLVWMQRSKKFLRSIHDEIILLDREGKVVDKYSY